MEYHQLDVGEAFFDEIVRKRQESGAEVVMVIQRPSAKVLLLTKEFYPAGVYRLPSGMIKRGETPEQALIREAWEETGLAVKAVRRLGVIRYIIEAESRRTDFRSYVMLTDETAGAPSPQDRQESIAGFREVNPCDLREVASELYALPEPWHDWGRFRAMAHNSVYRLMCPTSPARKDSPTAHSG
ncbi:MAG TPA: NUDIX hydrolase [Armatimonadota bacterium]|nr:NUDIX hydrolase [Armatimonadota bacterium]